MIKNEAKLWSSELCKYNLSIILSGEFVDKIYDDFDSQICANCKHWDKQIRMCNNKDSFAYDFKATVVQGDGCNKFARRSDGS